MIPPSNIAHFTALDQGKLWIDPEYVKRFCHLGLDSVASVMSYKQGQQVKKNRYREVIKITLPGSNLFLKRHYHPRLRDSIPELLKWHRPVSFARHELEAIGYLNDAGIKTMKPIAVGELPYRIFQGASFLITEEVQAIKLESYLANQPTLYQDNLRFRHKLIDELARLARSMHNSHIHHQDFYLGHLLLSWQGKEDFIITLIDLQRVHKRKRLRDRWRIKDLAQLNYSSPLGLVSLNDRLRFFRNYCQIKKFDQKARKLWHAIHKKYLKIKKHDRRIQERRNAGKQ